MLSWSGLFPKAGLLRRHLAWCPHCLAEDQETYDRLIWCLPQVKVCTLHKTKLREYCPNCGLHIPVLHSRSVPGECPSCKSPLADSAPSSSSVSKADLAMTQLVESFFLLVASKADTVWKRATPVDVVLNLCMQGAKIPDAAALGRILQVSRITAWYWLNGRSVPDFSHTLRICHVFGLSIDDFLNGKVGSRITIKHYDDPIFTTSRRKPRRFEAVAVQNAIDELSTQLSHRPPSLVEVSNAVGFPPRTIRNHLPETCRLIARKHRKFLKAQVAERKRSMKQGLQSAITRSRDEFTNPQRCNVVPFLTKPGLMRSAEARKTLQQLLLEFD